MAKDKSNKKVIIIVLISVFALSIILIGYGLLQNKSSHTSNNKAEEKNESIKRDKGNLDVEESLREDLEIRDVEIKNLSINKVDNYYSITFDMYNTTSKEKALLLIKFIFLDDKGEVIGEIEKEFQPLAPKEMITTELTTTDEKLFKASKIKLEEVRFTE